MGEENVVHSDELAWTSGPMHGDRYASESKRLGAAAAGKRLGCTLWNVPPGRAAFPHHAHLGVEEALYVLGGKGTLRLGDERFEVRAGTYVALPASPDLPHQLVNTGDGPLTYLCMSAAADLDVCLYPDTQKVLISQAPWPQGFRRLIHEGDEVGYFEAEPTEPIAFPEE